MRMRAGLANHEVSVNREKTKKEQKTSLTADQLQQLDSSSGFPSRSMRG